MGINVAVENIKIGNTGVEERVKVIDINDYVEFIEILFGTEKDENGNEIVDANGKPKKKIVGFEPKLEALTLSLDLDLGAMFTNGMAMGRSILDSEGKTVLTNVSSVGANGNGNMGIRASVKLEIAFAALSCSYFFFRFSMAYCPKPISLSSKRIVPPLFSSSAVFHAPSCPAKAASRRLSACTVGSL